MLNAVYRWWSVLVFLFVILQVAFAGYGAFFIANNVDDGGTVDEDKFDDGWGLHMGFGYLVVLAGLILLVIGLAGGYGKWRLGRHGLLALFLIIQPPLAWIGGGAPAAGFLHPLNALIIFTLSGWLAWSGWNARRAVVEPATSTA